MHLLLTALSHFGVMLYPPPPPPLPPTLVSLLTLVGLSVFAASLCWYITNASP